MLYDLWKCIVEGIGFGVGVAVVNAAFATIKRGK